MDLLISTFFLGLLRRIENEPSVRSTKKQFQPYITLFRNTFE